MADSLTGNNPLWIEKDLGPVTVYASAKEHGYDGTEDEWLQLIVNASSDAEAAEAAAERAEIAAATASAAYNTDLLAVTFDQTNSYAKGQHVIYSGKYYVLPNGHDANVTWENTTKTEEKVGNEISDLKTAFDNSKNVPYYVNMIDLGNYGYFINTSAATLIDPQPTSSGLTYSKIDAKEGDMFIIKGAGARDARLWAFTDSNLNVLLRSASNSNSYENPITVIAPANTAFLYTNTYLTENYQKSYVYREKQEDYIPYEKTDNLLSARRMEINNDQIKASFENGTVNIQYGTDTVIIPDVAISESFKLLPGPYTLAVYNKVITGNSNSIDISIKAIDGSHNYNLNLATNNRTINIPEENYYTLQIYRLQSRVEGSFNVSLVAGSTPVYLKPVTAVDYKMRALNLSNVARFYGTDDLQVYLYSTNYIYMASGEVTGKTIDEIYSSVSTYAKAFLIDVAGYETVYYPVFATTSQMGSLFLDENDIIIKGVISDKAGFNTINIPDNAKYMLVSVSGGWYNAFGDTYKVALSLFGGGSTVSESIPSSTPFENVNKNMCLAGIKTQIANNKLPFAEGYLFHKLQNNDGSLWYGSDFNRIDKIGDVSFNPTLMRFAISPKDGRIIAVQRDVRNGIWVWDGTAETHLTNFATQPMAWLYNSGVDFINSGTDEYCVFAEYSSTVVSGNVLNVWRGKYPYTSVSDWSIVYSQSQGTQITHFHMIRRDPWSNILYLTAGDSSPESKWWYSTDYGATWTLLVSGSDTGWGNSLCRTINFIFTEDYIYWATDHGQAGAQHHTLNRIARNSQTGVMDLSTKEQLTLLPQLYATNSLCYVESPNGLFMYDRIDTASSSVFGEPIRMLFWDFATEQLVEIASLKLTQETWGGSRGKCYINYTNSKQPMPAMGFSIDTPCIFDLVCDDPSRIGTIAYDVGSKTVRTIDY